MQMLFSTENKQTQKRRWYVRWENKNERTTTTVKTMELLLMKKKSDGMFVDKKQRWKDFDKRQLMEK